LGGQFGLSKLESTLVDQEIVGAQALLPLLICCILPLGAAIDRKCNLIFGADALSRSAMAASS
jgi:hypothetical protein